MKFIKVFLCTCLFSSFAFALDLNGVWKNDGYQIHIQNKSTLQIQVDFVLTGDSLTYFLDNKWHVSQAGNYLVKTRSSQPPFEGDTLIVEQKVYSPDSKLFLSLTHKYFKGDKGTLRWNRIWSMDTGVMSDDQVLVKARN